MLGPEQLNDALLEVQKSQRLHQVQQHRTAHHRHQKTHESPQHKKVHGKNLFLSSLLQKCC